jgi:hypothetical protein
MTTEQLNLLPPADRATYIQIVSIVFLSPSHFNFVLYYFRGSLFLFLNRQWTTLGVLTTYFPTYSLIFGRWCIDFHFFCDWEYIVSFAILSPTG